jgi:tRNA threonylcarbamoyladenosine biosynthesis protein TsaB
MHLLAIDTSGPALSLALFDDSVLVGQHHHIIGRGHAEQIIPAIGALPFGGRADIIIAGCGPGSFTGIRAGVAAARALAYGWNGTALGMSSLALIAAGVDAEHSSCVVAIEGGHGALFVQAFALPSLQPLTSVRSLAPSEAAAAHKEHVVAGSGAERLIAARGFGTLIDSEARASRALMLPEPLRNWLPSPVYGRAPDAKAIAA